MKTFELPIFGIVVEVSEDGSGSISSTDLKSDPNDGIPDEGDEFYDAAIDGIESMILGHACAGIDISTPEYLEGIETAVNACGNHF